MRKNIFSIISIFLIIFVAMSSFAFTANGAKVNSSQQTNTFDNLDYGCPVDTKSDTVLLVNLDTGVTVYSKEADTKRYPASLTKIMTYIVVADHIENLNTKIKIKESALKSLEGTGSSLSAVYDNIGKSMTVKQLLQCLMISSGNDAALVLADYIGGDKSVKGFVKMMNEKAEELGCENTHFVNPHGLHNKNHYTTARDMYKIANYALSLPQFSDITNSVGYTIGDTYYSTTNFLIDSTSGDYYYQYAKGVKTGTTDEAGRCLVTTAVADGYSYIAILMHAPYNEAEGITEYYTMTDAAELFRWALTSITLRQVVTRETPVCEEKVDLSWDKSSIQLSAEEDFSVLLPDTIKDEDITIETDVPSSIVAPINEGDYVGTATVYYEGKEVSSFNLVADESVERSGLLYTLDLIKNVFTSVYFIVAALVVVVLFALYLVVVVKHNKNKKRNRKQVKHYRHM